MWAFSLELSYFHIFSKVLLFAQLKAETISFLTASCLQFDLIGELRYPTVSPFQNETLV